MMNKSMQFRDGNFCEFSANWQVVSDDRLIKCKKKQQPSSYPEWDIQVRK